MIIIIFLFRVTRKSLRRKPPLQHDDTLDPDDDHDNTKDWWTKYFWSYEKLILESKALSDNSRSKVLGQPIPTPKAERSTSRLGFKSTKALMPSPKHLQQVEKNKASTALFHVRCFIL